ncbi:MAG: hypothetical protein RR657_07755 [Peptostreptococcaceae bacterium]
MGKNLNTVFWGFLTLVVTINIGQVSVLPGFIGYFIIFTGLKKLSCEGEHDNGVICSKSSKGFKIGVLPAKVMVFVTFCFFVISPFQQNLPAVVTGFIKIIVLASAIGEILVVYSILKGIYEECSYRNIKIKGDNIFLLWYVYLFSRISVVLLGYYTLNFYSPSDGFTGISLLIMITSLIINICIIVTIKSSVKLDNPIIVEGSLTGEGGISSIGKEFK